jgi:putative mycofactocin binding protein MftB
VPPRADAIGATTFDGTTADGTTADGTTADGTTADGTTFDGTRPWALHPQVSLRPESFGALAYHFGTRRLSFLKSRTLLTVVESLAEQPSGRDACRAAGVVDDEIGRYERALDALARSGMISERRAT